MSASEKLKDLESSMRYVNSVKYNPNSNAILAALPQIVELTLWVEQTIKNFEEYGEVSFIPLIDSLEELDKALS